MELKKRSFLILALFYVDLTLHGSIIFGWNSLSQIYKLEVPELSKETRKIFTILCGQILAAKVILMMKSTKAPLCSL